jgi:hypothetical protein
MAVWLVPLFLVDAAFSLFAGFLEYNPQATDSQVQDITAIFNLTLCPPYVLSSYQIIQRIIIHLVFRRG